MVQSRFPSSVRSVACGLYPYRGTTTRTLSNNASVLSARNNIRTLARSTESYVWPVCGCAGVRLNLSVRAGIRAHAEPHTENRPYCRPALLPKPYEPA
jgi:hypothetical protein